MIRLNPGFLPAFRFDGHSTVSQEYSRIDAIDNEVESVASVSNPFDELPSDRLTACIGSSGCIMEGVVSQVGLNRFVRCLQQQFIPEIDRDDNATLEHFGR